MGGDGDLALPSIKKRSLTAEFKHSPGSAGLCGHWGGAAGISCSNGNGHQNFAPDPCKPRREAWTQRIVKVTRVTKSNYLMLQDK